MIPPSARRLGALLVTSDPRSAADLARALGTLPDRQLECHEAADARTASELADTLGEALDLAIVELPLAGGDGLALLSELARSWPLAERLVLDSGATLDGALAALEHGATAYLRAPVGPDDLLRTSERLLRRRDALAAARGGGLGAAELADAVPAYLLALDDQGRLILWNSRLEQATGFSRQEMLGRPGRELAEPDGDRKLALKSGDQRLVRWRHADVTRADGSRVRYALGLDVTEEQSMLRRTLRAERLAAAGTLATGLAHELRNPLNSAVLQLQVLRRRLERHGAAQEAESILNLVEDELGRLERLTSDFLAFAQPRPSVFKRVELNALVGRIARELRAELEDRRIELEASLDPGAGFIEAAPEQLRQALMNLVQNAIEAMADGGTLRLSTRAPDALGRVAVWIEDTGPGLPEDAPIFDAFFTTKRGGTGLGLAIVHRIVGDHGGSVGFDSRPGATRFTVMLPQLVGSGTKR